LVPGDVITQVSGAHPRSVPELIAALNAGTPAIVLVHRANRAVRLTLDHAAAAPDLGFMPVSDGGVQLDSVAKDSELYAAGVRAGDSLTRIDGAPATKAALKRLEDGKPHALVVSMGARSKEVVFQP
jgi:predicted metalloprotease with PDZ domain